MVNDKLDDLKGSLEDALDRLLGTRKAVCPHCRQVERLIKDTNVLSPHVYIPNEDALDFSKGIDFSMIVDCPGSGCTVNVI